MAKLYFKYGAMGSSKTAQALITRFNYIEQGMNVWLIKPATDSRDGVAVLRSRIGLEAEAFPLSSAASVLDIFKNEFIGKIDVIIVDEAQFLSPDQVDELHDIVNDYDIPVICFGLRTDFLTHLFPGSRRLLELAESISEIKTICECGSKATVNARFESNGKIATSGEQVFLGGNESYRAMCHKCWKRKIKEQNGN